MRATPLSLQTRVINFRDGVERRSIFHPPRVRIISFTVVSFYDFTVKGGRKIGNVKP